MLMPTQRRLFELWAACAAWRDKYQPLSAETVPQSDECMLHAHEMVIAVCDIIGYAEFEEDDRGTHGV